MTNSQTPTLAPIPTQAGLAAVYGLPEDAAQLEWSHVVTQMTAAKTYWLATITHDGAPHSRPFDGLWLDNNLYFGGSPRSVWRQNLLHEPRVCINVENGIEPTILHGIVHSIRPGPALAEILADASNAKYGYGQSAKDYQGIESLRFEPRRVYAWTLLYKDATRWDFQKDISNE